MSNHFSAHPVRTALAGGVAGVTLGLVGTAWAVSGSTTTTTPSSGQSTVPPVTRAPGARGPGRGRGFGGRHGGPGKGAGGVVSAVSATSISYRLPDGTTRTAGLTPTTTYRRDGQTAKQSDLAVGERVAVRLVDPSASSPQAASVSIQDPRLAGTVSSVSGDTIVIVDGDGFHRTIKTSGATTYTDNGSPASSSAVTTGSQLRAVGAVDPDGTDLDATRVDVGRPMPGNRPARPTA